MKILKNTLLISVLLVLLTIITGCTGSRIMPNQLYEFFATGDFTANYWVRGGDVLPYIQSEHVHQGKYAVEFSNLSEDESSEMFIDLDIEEGSVIRFYINLFGDSMESSLQFYIDDTLAGQWFSQNEWKSVIRELPAGEHRLRWVFINNYRDAKAWLDDIMISKLIPLGEKIAFKDDAFKQMVLNQIGKLGGENTPVIISKEDLFENTQSEGHFPDGLRLQENWTLMRNTDVRYCDSDVYANEVKDIELLLIDGLGLSSAPITDLTGIENFNHLSYLLVIGPGISDISLLSELKEIRMTQLLLTNVDDITPLDTSAQDGALENLVIFNESSINDHLSDQSVNALGTWVSLKSLVLSSVAISDSGFLSHLIHLENLELANTQISDINPLESLNALKTLWLENMPIDNIEALRALDNLEKELILRNLEISDLEPLKTLTKLRRLEIKETDVNDIEALQHLKALEELVLDDLGISDIGPLASLTTLKAIRIVHNQVKDINALRNLTNVTWMELNNNLIEDISPIAQGLITTLERLNIKENQLNLTPGSVDMQNIKKLIDAGITVYY